VSALHERLKEEMRNALRAGDKPRLGVLRMALAAVKQREVDTRETQDDDAVQRVLEKLIKQGRDSLEQYRQGGREDLAAKEAYEIGVLEEYLPEPLGEAELGALIDAAIRDTGAASIKDMGKVMAQIKSRAAGRADMAAVGALVKSRLNAG
jgi:uncharacterized protein YqeY